MSWGKVKIGDCCEITSSKRIFYSEYVESGVPFYRSKEIIESSSGQAISEPLFISQERLKRAIMWEKHIRMPGTWSVPN